MSADLVARFALLDKGMDELLELTGTQLPSEQSNFSNNLINNPTPALSSIKGEAPPPPPPLPCDVVRTLMPTLPSAPEPHDPSPSTDAADELDEAEGDTEADAEEADDDDADDEEEEAGQGAYSEGDEDEDEWDDDEDIGYVLIALSEEEFMEMEEVRWCACA